MAVMIEIDMPENCATCRIKKRCEEGIAGGWREDKRVDDCPLKEIITCKECDNRCTGGYCTKHDITVTKDFYCADAERRE